jgi:hypothetical protein
VLWLDEGGSELVGQKKKIAIAKLKEYKSPGSDQITVELI